MRKVLVLCTGNSCRSQMAEGYLRHYAGSAADIYSAGIETHGVNPQAIASMKRDGIDISTHTSNNVDEYKDLDFELVLTVCDNANERCPFFAGNVRRFHSNFPDPAKAKGTAQEIEKAFDVTRDLIKAYCKEFTNDPPPPKLAASLILIFPVIGSRVSIESVTAPLGGVL